MPWRYADLLRYLDRLGEHQIHCGLDRVHAAAARLGHPEQRHPVIHIAGTNGKGSTGAFLRALLSAHGARVGHYTSPHLIDFTERMTVDGIALAGDRLALLAEAIDRQCADCELSYFEFTTLLAFCAFAELRLDYVIAEVGLGGRWDATNIVTPVVGVITPIAMDHQQYLGTTIAAIAAEKCGIIKSGIPIVAAPQAFAEALQVIATTCCDQGAPLHRAAPVDADVELGLPGAHQRVNAGVALAAAEIVLRSASCVRRPAFRDTELTQHAASTFAKASVDKRSTRHVMHSMSYASLARAHWPGRCEWLARDPPILFDGAHNVAGAEALAAYIAEIRDGREVICCLGILRDKDIGGMIRALRDVVNRFIAIAAPTPRGLPAQELAKAIRHEGGRVVSEAQGLHEGLINVSHRGSPTLTVITGSLYLYASAVGVMRK